MLAVELGIYKSFFPSRFKEVNRVKKHNCASATAHDVCIIVLIEESNKLYDCK